LKPIVALLAQVDLPSLGQEGPEDLRRLLAIFFTLFGLGFFVAVLGHLFRSRVMVGIGVTMVFLGTALFMVAIAEEG
jgi:hypothetical protein